MKLCLIKLAAIYLGPPKAFPVRFPLHIHQWYTFEKAAIQKSIKFRVAHDFIITSSSCKHHMVIETKAPQEQPPEPFSLPSVRS